MSIDYFKISIKDAITLVPREVEIEQCVLSAGASPFCDFIVRDTIGNPRSRTPGTVFQVDNFQVNAASIKTSGIDVAMNYTARVGNDKRLTFNLAYTYLDKLTLKPLAGVAIENNRGQLDGDGRLGAGFKHRANITTVLEWGPVEFSWKANLLSSIYDTLPSQGPELDPEFNHVGFYSYHDVQLRWKLGKDQPIEIYAGVDNVFDKKPPLIDQNGASNITGTETAADSYDAIGRSFYVGATIQF
jgi:outer membrane receptor protein involved in Fe transport